MWLVLCLTIDLVASLLLPLMRLLWLIILRDSALGPKGVMATLLAISFAISGFTLSHVNDCPSREKHASALLDSQPQPPDPLVCLSI